MLVTDLAELFTMVLESRKVLQELGIEEIYYIDTDVLQVDVNQVIFFVRPDKAHMKRIVRIIRNNQISFQQKNYLLIFCPRSTVVCKEYLEKEAVMGNLQIRNFNFDLIPINDEVLSLEINDSLEHLYLRKELTILQVVAESIQRMQVVFGKFHQIYAKGDFAK